MNEVTKMNNPSTIHPLIGILPSGPQPAPDQTPESIARAKAYQRSERARVELQGVIFRDVDGLGALAAVLRGDAR